MEASELRIGNYVNTERGFKKISFVSIDWTGFVECEPIPLSDQILLDCGFVSKLGKFGNEYHNDNFSIYTSEKGTFCFVWDNFLRDVYFLHELQNLYHILKNKELTINLKK